MTTASGASRNGGRREERIGSATQAIAARQKAVEEYEAARTARLGSLAQDRAAASAAKRHRRGNCAL